MSEAWDSKTGVVLPGTYLGDCLGIRHLAVHLEDVRKLEDKVVYYNGTAGVNPHVSTEDLRAFYDLQKSRDIWAQFGLPSNKRRSFSG